MALANGSYLGTGVFEGRKDGRNSRCNTALHFHSRVGAFRENVISIFHGISLA